MGAFTLTGGIVSNGNEDVNRGGTFSSLTFTGSFNAPDPSHRARHRDLHRQFPRHLQLRLLHRGCQQRALPGQTIGVDGLGRAELQSGTPALSGSYAFGSKGDTSFLSGVNMAGRFTASGGNITVGARDSVQDGNVASNVSFTGTYTQAVNGRAVVSLTTAANKNLVVWMVSPTRGLFLVNDPNTVQDGSLDLQQVSTFSNSTMNGQFGFIMDGFDAGGAKDRVGTLQWDGSGGLVLNEFTNAAGAITVP